MGYIFRENDKFVGTDIVGALLHYNGTTATCTIEQYILITPIFRSRLWKEALG
jgi:hypothetical protein